MLDANRIVFATGSKWRSDGFGRSNTQAIKKLNNNANTYNPDDIMDGNLPSGNIAIFDDDYYYLGPVIAELLQKKGNQVTFISTSAVVCEFGNFTSEQFNYQRSLNYGSHQHFP